MQTFSNNVNPAEPIRGRPSTLSLREKNLRALVQKYSELPELQKDRVDFLRKVQYHLSDKAFERLIPAEAVEEDCQQPQSSSNCQGTSQVDMFADRENVEPTEEWPPLPSLSSSMSPFDFGEA